MAVRRALAILEGLRNSLDSLGDGTLLCGCEPSSDRLCEWCIEQDEALASP